MADYLLNLVCQDLGKEIQDEAQKKFKTISSRIPEHEYELLKQTAKERGFPIYKFVEHLTSADLENEIIHKKFDAEDTSGGEKMVSFSIDKDFHHFLKQRSIDLELSLQDYIKSIIYNETH